MRRLPSTRLLLRANSCTSQLSIRLTSYICPTYVHLLFLFLAQQRLGTHASWHAPFISQPGAPASLRGAAASGAALSFRAWSFLAALPGRCLYSRVSVHIVPESPRVCCMHTWAEPEPEKISDQGLCSCVLRILATDVCGAKKARHGRSKKVERH